MFDYKTATQESAREFATNVNLDQLDVSNHFLFQSDAHWPLFERLRNEDPVHFHADSRYGPFWSVTSHDAIKDIEADHHRFSSEPSITIIDATGVAVTGVARGNSTSFIAMDQPRHDEQRRTVSPVVAPPNLAKMEGLIRERVEDILDNLPIGEEFNWVKRVSIELTTRMLATLFDFPYEERSRLTYWSDVAVMGPRSGYVDTWDEARAELQNCLAYFQELRRERVNPDHDGFDLLTLLAQNPDTRDMGPEEFLGNLMLLIVGGNDTTRNSITGGVLALHDNPEEYQKLKLNPSLVRSLVPEVIRWQSPVAHMARTAMADIELGGKHIKKLDKVVMWYISGNRDESEIDSADRFIIDRANPRKHLSFGFGIHRCLGNRLAEMQLTILWEEILRQKLHIEVVAEPVFLRSNFIHGIRDLPVVVKRG